MGFRAITVSGTHWGCSGLEVYSPPPVDKGGWLLNLLLEHSPLAFSIKTHPWLLRQILDPSEVQFCLPSTTRLLRALLMYIFSLSCHFLLYQLLTSSALDSANAMKPTVSADSILQDLDSSNLGNPGSPAISFLPRAMMVWKTLGCPFLLAR